MQELLTSLGISTEGLNLGTLTLSSLLNALVVLLICMVAMRIILSIFRRLLSHPTVDERVHRYALSGIRLLLWIVTVLIVADTLGIPITSLVAMLSVFTLAISLAVQSVLGNIAGGIVIMLTKPFKEGDYIDTPEGSGTVEQMTLTYTYLNTGDHLRIILPNSTLSAGKVINHSALSTRRVTHSVTASYDAPTETVRSACLAAAARTDKALADPAPTVLVTAYGESSITYSVRIWCNSADYWDVYYASLEHIRACFAEAGVEMTYNHLNVHILDK